MFFLQQYPLIAGLLALGVLTLCACALLAINQWGHTRLIPQGLCGTLSLESIESDPIDCIDSHTHLAMNMAAHATVAEQINALLPQTQCGQCGYAGCAPYAQAITEGEAINRCPPGGITTVVRLAQLLDLPVIALDTHAQQVQRPPSKAFIREAECIGCTKCIQACPVDAIIGAAKMMHTVIASECTGCDLCVEPCPVDCIDMIVSPTHSAPIALVHTPNTVPLGVRV